MRLRKLVGTILTGALLMTSGITAFAAMPEGTVVVGTDAYKMDSLQGDILKDYKESLKKSYNVIKYKGFDGKWIVKEVGDVYNQAVVNDIYYFHNDGVSKTIYDTFKLIPDNSWVVGNVAHSLAKKEQGLAAHAIKMKLEDEGRVVRSKVAGEWYFLILREDDDNIEIKKNGTIYNKEYLPAVTYHNPNGSTVKYEKADGDIVK